MKYCPTCNTRYDEEIIRFCTKDGTPLVNDEEPNFIGIPSDSMPPADEDDPGEVTIVRNNISAPPPPPDDDLNFEDAKVPPQRIVVSTEREPVRPGVFPPERQTYQAPPKKTNTLLVVFLTMLGTLVILGGGFGLVWLMQRGGSTDPFANSNAANVDTNLSTNFNIDTNFNFNTNINANVNANANANANRSPTPTPRPSPSPSPSPTPDEDDVDDPTANTNSRPPSTPTPNATPTPRTPATPANRVVNGGMLNGRAINLSTPVYPAAARQLRASGQVMVEVFVDESGRVTSARAVSGHPLLRGAAEAAARQSRINPLRIDNETVKTTGVLLYNFRDN